MNPLTLMALVALTAVAFSVQAQTPRDLNDLLDTRARRGERELEDRGYRHRKSMDIKDNAIDYWWNSRKERCVAVTIKDGRFSSIMKQPEAMCGKDGSDDDRDRDRRRHSGRSGDLRALEGARAHRGDRELEDMGYRHRKTLKIKDNAIDYWWSRREQQCIAVTIKDGRFSSIMKQPEAMCDDDR